MGNSAGSSRLCVQESADLSSSELIFFSPELMSFPSAFVDPALTHLPQCMHGSHINFTSSILLTQC